MSYIAAKDTPIENVIEVASLNHQQALARIRRMQNSSTVIDVYATIYCSLFLIVVIIILLFAYCVPNWAFNGFSCCGIYGMGRRGEIDYTTASFHRHRAKMRNSRLLKTKRLQRAALREATSCSRPVRNDYTLCSQV